MEDLCKQDIHVLRYFSSLITVSQGKVTNVTDPVINKCPLASHLYRKFKNLPDDKEALKEAIRTVVEQKIEKYGFFTARRTFNDTAPYVPYGASEMIRSAFDSKLIDAAIMVSDGAGTVVVTEGKTAQAIGARMNTLVRTTRIDETVNSLIGMKCHVVSKDAAIDQVQGVNIAIKEGYRRIAVTVTGHDLGAIHKIRNIGYFSGVEIIILVVCTRLIEPSSLNNVFEQADLVWGCSSQDVKEMLGAQALLQLSKVIPVFVMTQRGVRFSSGHIKNLPVADIIKHKKQYIVSHEGQGQKMQVGSSSVFLREANLPELVTK